jgi:hypothetical protein
LKNKVSTCRYSPTTWFLPQPPLAALLIILLHAGAITVEASQIYDHITLYLKSFTHQSAVSPRKTPM